MTAAQCCAHNRTQSGRERGTRTHLRVGRGRRLPPEGGDIGTALSSGGTARPQRTSQRHSGHRQHRSDFGPARRGGGPPGRRTQHRNTRRSNNAGCQGRFHT